MRKLFFAAAAALLTLAGASHAASVLSVSPLGEVAQAQQITVKFSGAVVAFGDLRSPDPFTVQCTGAAPTGAGRWATDRVWIYDFSAALPPGTQCHLKLRADWKSSDGSVTGATDFSFNTGGPAVAMAQPSSGSEIDEDQFFLLELNGLATEQSMLANTWCEVDGIGERLPLRFITGNARDDMLKSRRISPKKAEKIVLTACARPLPADTAVRLVWGKGIAAVANPAIVTRIEQRFAYRVRKPFTAEFSCERERAGAPCIPIMPMSLHFSAPVPRALAEKVRLKSEQGRELAPVFNQDDHEEDLSRLSFPAPLAEDSNFRIDVPRDLKDNAGRPLANAALFPLAVKTGQAPPIAKFAAAPFGVVELHGDAMLPVTLRHVQADLRTASPTGQVRIKRVQSDADMLAWYAKLRRASEWTSREVSWLSAERDARRLELPQLQGGDPRPFEVIGIPFTEPGYHVVEIESQRLGASLLDKKAPMFVRTGVLVTNLGVHFKHGRENSLVWVTTLDFGKPVADAEVAVNGCDGQRLWAGRTDPQGLARVPPLAVESKKCSSASNLFVTARKADKNGVIDTAFVFSDWQKGIEPWRFNVPTSRDSNPDLRAHTVFDRTLFRAGETVSMKHFLRAEIAGGLALVPAADLPTRLKIVHQGSGQEFAVPLQWNAQRSAVSAWNISPAAKLGVYQVMLEREATSKTGRSSWTSGDFRVEEFRLPLVDAKVNGPKGVQVAPREVSMGLQLTYLSGGAMSHAPARASALLKNRFVEFPGYEEFSFDLPRDEESGHTSDSTLVADKLPLKTDTAGTASIALKELPKIERPSELVTEVTFNDPNGEVQTASARVALWPSGVVVGIRAGSWISSRGKAKFTALALDTNGKPLSGQSIEVRGRRTQFISTRKRMVGGFYAYDNQREAKDMGALCSGRTDGRGFLLCDATFDVAGQIDLVASAKDSAGNPARAATSLWVTQQGELWFAQDNDDRIDLLPEKKRYEPGETARLQVRMPFREATALISVEREGVISTRVVTLRGNDPTVDLKIEPGWGPNVYVSALVLRGRIRHVPWYSFFTWGWKEPVHWARSFWVEGREYQAPTAMVDLSKPAFKLGVAALQVGIAEHELKVSVTTDRTQYSVRQKAIARIQVTQDGKPLAGAEVAFAAVDEGLLALRDNQSWDLLSAMIQKRPWGVETSTAQSEIIGRRHYGRKAVAAGGGGGGSSTRELFDTLLIWKPQVQLDAKGEAVVEVPLNDALTSFKLVAVADSGTQRFGTGSASIRVTQDLQVLPGLPPLVREGDQFSAMLTLRNTTEREMRVRASLQGTVNSPVNTVRPGLVFAPQDLLLAPGAAKEISWPVDVPAEATSIAWEAAAEEQSAAPAQRAKDRLKLTQLVSAAVPVRVLQATLEQLDGRFAMPVAAPADALSEAGVKRGGLLVAVQPSLSGALPGMRRYFETYPFACLEQKVSKSVGLHDTKMWTGLANTLPTYLDRDGLASYFPPTAGDAARGSDRLTAYVLAATHEAGFELPAAARTRMLDGLTAFIDGRIERKFWSPRADLDVRKLAAIEALARYDRAQGRMLGSINLTPNLWPTAAVIDWLNILRRVTDIPDHAQRLSEANQILRSRLTYAGTTLKFSTEADDFWWWLMDSADANAARLILAVLPDPAWKDDLPRMVVGALSRQRGGAWLTTTANLWGSLALDKFSAKFESTRVAGKTMANTGEQAQDIDWSLQPAGGTVKLPWPGAAGALRVEQIGSGKPWLTVQSLAAIPLKAPIRAGYSIVRSVSPVEQKDKGKWSRGDLVRVRLEIDAQTDMTWVVVSDPVPAGATQLGSGLGRDSEIATRDEKREDRTSAAFEERSFEAFRSYFEFLPRGKHVIEYTLRLNNPGRFALPPSRVEAMYAPETFGELPNAVVEVQP